VRLRDQMDPDEPHNRCAPLWQQHLELNPDQADFAEDTEREPAEPTFRTGAN
jgi:hypothetical protein